MKRPPKTPHRQQKVKKPALLATPTAPPREKWSLDNPPPGPVMSIDDLTELLGPEGGGKNAVYEKVRAGVFPSIRSGARGKISILTLPTLQILKGEREPGSPKPIEPRPTGRGNKSLAAATP